MNSPAAPLLFILFSLLLQESSATRSILQHRLQQRRIKRTPEGLLAYQRSSGRLSEEMRTIFSTSSDKVAETIYNKLFSKIYSIGSGKLDVLVMMDSSAALGFSNFLNGKQFLASLVNFMPKDAFSRNLRFSMLSYAASADITKEFEFNYTSYREMTRRAIINARYINGTAQHTALSLYWAESIFDSYSSSSTQKIMIIATNGRSNDDDFLLGITYAPVLHNKGIEIFVVALGEHLDRTKVGILASRPREDHIFAIKDASEKDSVLWHLEAMIRRRRFGS